MAGRRQLRSKKFSGSCVLSTFNLVEFVME